MLSAELARVESNLRRVEAFLSSGSGQQAGQFEWAAPLDSPASSQDDDTAWDDSRVYPPPSADAAREQQQPWEWHLPLPEAHPSGRRAEWSPVADVRPRAGGPLWEQLQRGDGGGEAHRGAGRPQPFRLSSPALLAGRHSKARVAAEVELERSAQAPFVPATNGATNYTQLKRERLLAERAAREAAEAAECTFRPRLRGRAPRASAPGPGSTQAAGERLYQLAFRRSAELDAKRAEKSAASSGLTFRPDTSLSRRSRSESPGPRRPLHERVADLVRAQHAARASQAAAQEAAVAPFKPRVDPVSAALAAQLHSSTAGPVPVVERLTGEASQARIASARAKAVALVAAEEECTFSPSVNATTERLVARMAALGRPADFVTRQAAYGTVAASHKAAVAAAAHTAEVSGGGGAADQVLGSSARYHHTLKETPEERARRLAVTDAQRREAERESRQQAVMEAECPFEPQLTEVTRKLAPQATPLRELVQDTRREAARAAAAAAAEEAVRQECTFAPDVRASTKSVRLSLPSAAAAPAASRASVFITHPDEAVAALREAAAARARQAELAAQERELQELASCTFRPQLVARQPRPASAGGSRPVLVRGYGSFMNRAANAVLLKREAEERERKVFLTDVSQRPPKTTHTVPQPFTLAFQQRAAERAAARAALEAQVESQRASQAPFRPTTNEGLLSQRLRRALAMSSD